MQTARILIVEDEWLTGQSMQITLETQGYKITEIVATGEAALDSVKNNVPDLVIMDIELAGKIDGISTARTIRRNYDLPVIFITRREDDDTFRNAKETFPQNYISKPFSDAALIRAVVLALQNAPHPEINSESDDLHSAGSIFVPATNGFKHKLMLRDVLYIKAKGAYSEIYFEVPANSSDPSRKKNGDNFYEVSLSSNQVAKQLAHKSVLRVHKSYYVNIDKVDKINGNTLYIGEKQINIGPEYNTETLKKSLKSLRHNSL